MPITITHAKSNTIADFTGTVTVLNSSGGTATVAATNLVRPSDWNSNHTATIELVGSELPSFGLFFEPTPLPNTNSTLFAMAQGSAYVAPVNIPMQMNSGQLNHFIAMAAGFLGGAVYSATSTGSMNHQVTHDHQIALYDQGTGASTTRWESIWSTRVSFLASWSRSVNGTTSSQVSVSNYLTVSFPSQWDASGGITYGSTSQSGTTSAGASTAASTLANNVITGAGAYLSGSMMLPFPLNTKLSAGDYFMMHIHVSSTATAGTRYTAGTMLGAASKLGLLEYGLSSHKRLGQSAADSTSVPDVNFIYATSTTSPPSNFATSDRRNLGNRGYWNYKKTNY